jgi:transcriptional regulator with XRE-family HTH domain
MIHDQFREARIAAGLTQAEVARRAGVLRKQVQVLESGGNVTLETLRKLAPVIPNLRRVSLGGLEIVAENADLEEARRAALDLFDVARRLVAALGASPGADPARRDTATGAVRYTSASATERETAERLEQKLGEKRKPRKGDA